MIAYEDVKPFVTMLGGAHDVSPKKMMVDEAKRARLVKRFRATHLVELTVKGSASDSAIQTTVYALSPFRADSRQNLPLAVTLPKEDLEVIARRHPL